MPQNDIDIAEVLKDPDFINLPMTEKRKFLLRHDEDFRALPIPEQAKFIVNISSGQGPAPEPSGSVIGGMLSQGADIVKGITGEMTASGQLKQGIINAVDPTGIVRTGVAQVPVAWKAAKETVQAAAHPTQVNPKLGLHIAEALTPIAGPVAADLEDKPWKEAIGRGIVDMATFASGELARLIKPGRPMANLSIPEMKEAMGWSVWDAMYNATQKIRANVSALADNVSKAVDDPARNPVPVINASEYVDALKNAWERYIATGNADPKAVVGHKIPLDIQKSVQEAFGSPGGRWTFEQAKQVRSALGEYLSKSKDPNVKGVARDGYVDLTQQMTQAAEDAGVGKDFASYNAMHSHLMGLNRAVLDAVRKSKTGVQVLSILTDENKEGYVRSVVFPSLKKFGLDVEAVEKAMEAGKSGAKPRLVQGWQRRYFYGTAGHLLTGGTMPWLLGAAGAGIADEWLAARRAAAGMEAAQMTPNFLKGVGITKGKIVLGPTAPTMPPPIPGTVNATPAAAPAVAPPATVPARLPKVGSVAEPAPVAAPAAAAPKPVVATPAPAPEPVPVAPVEPVAPAAPVDPYATTSEKITYLKNLSDVIYKLGRGSKKVLTERQFGWIESETGLDMTDPANLAKARSILTNKRNLIIKLSKKSKAAKGGK